MAFRFDVCKITACAFSPKMPSAADALIAPLNCTSAYYMFCTFDLKFKKSWFMSKVMFEELTVSRSVHYAWCYQCITNTCPICKRRTQWRSRKILRHPCQADIHYNCSGLWLDYFESAFSKGIWCCRAGVEGLFPFNHLYDDNDFMECIEELSQYSNITARLHNSAKVFNPFDINEDDNDFIEYHGDIDPDKCYFNEYLYKSFKNCNCYINDSFNKYLTKHAISKTYFFFRCAFDYKKHTCKLFCFSVIHRQPWSLFYCHWIIGYMLRPI